MTPTLMLTLVLIPPAPPPVVDGKANSPAANSHGGPGTEIRPPERMPPDAVPAWAAQPVEAAPVQGPVRDWIADVRAMLGEFRQWVRDLLDRIGDRWQDREAAIRAALAEWRASLRDEWADFRWNLRWGFRLTVSVVATTWAAWVVGKFRGV